MAHAPRLTVRVGQDRYDSPVAAPLVRELLAELHDRYGQDDADPDRLDAPQLAAPHGTFLVAWLGADAIGCGGLRRADEGIGEIKRMYVRPAWRGHGIGRRLLDAIETRARTLGYERLILETGTRQPEAIGLYTSAGYAPIAPYGAYRSSPLSRCFARELR
ncbi:MAG TPA: GNAT family N-acetyltransferase [Acidimicrobiia bacterium]|nr:GNAT family N-acetyltransferase [Acidimicrobiia bacterium]